MVIEKKIKKSSEKFVVLIKTKCHEEDHDQEDAYQEEFIDIADLEDLDDVGGLENIPVMAPSIHIPITDTAVITLIITLTTTVLLITPPMSSETTKLLNPHNPLPLLNHNVIEWRSKKILYFVLQDLHSVRKTRPGSVSVQMVQPSQSQQLAAGSKSVRCS